MNFANVKNITIPEGGVKKIVDTLTGVVLWEKKNEPTVDYFWIENISGSVNTIKLETKYSTSKRSNILYKINNGGWCDDIYNGVDLQPNDKMYFKGNNRKIESVFRTTHKYNIGGNITTLLNENTTDTYDGEGYVFSQLFSQTLLVDASNLVMNVNGLTPHCYEEMFWACRELLVAPQLPAMGLGDYCYYGMFRLCEKLRETPVLPANTLKNSCYHWMFYKCSSLKYVYYGGMNDLHINYSQSWLGDVAAKGTFYFNNNRTYAVQPIGDPNGVPSGWSQVRMNF